MAGELLPAREENSVGGAHECLAGGRISLCCPRCRHELTACVERLNCPGCCVLYAIQGGVPVMADLAEDGLGADYKRRQMEFFDRESEEFEIARPHGQPRLYRWLMAEKFRRSIRNVEYLLRDATVLTVCGGSGMDAEFLAREGARVVTSDLSVGAAQRAVERARRHGLTVEAVVADAERLPFADRSIDIVYVHDGLHHLSDPLVGLAEMCRVARRAVLMTEPSRAAVTQLAVRAGIAESVENAGNRVERVSVDDVSAELARNGLEVVGVDRYAMYYQHQPGWGMRFFSRPRSYRAALVAIGLFNATLGSMGNKLSVRALRRTEFDRL